MRWLLACFLAFAPSAAWADGMMWEAPSAKDIIAEKAQQAWLEWDGGRERLTIAVDPERVTPRLAWILPLPVPAAQATLSLTEKLPNWNGREVRLAAQLSLHPFMTAFLFLMFALAGAGAGQFAVVIAIIALLNGIAIGPSFGPGNAGISDAVRVSQHTELGGLASELAEAPTLEAFEAYLAAKGSVVPEAGRAAIGEHIRSGGSFVLSWAKDAHVDKSLAVSVEFPAAKPWYPVRLTSGYGKTKTPIDLRLSGWWVPETGPERLRVGYYASGMEPRAQTRLLYQGAASALTEDWTLKSRGWSPDLRTAALAADSPFLLGFLLLLVSSLLGGAAVAWTAFPDWRGPHALGALLRFGAYGVLPVIGQGLALRQLRSEADGVPPVPLPEGMTAEEVRTLKRWGLGLMGLGFLCVFGVFPWPDSVVPFGAAFASGGLGVALFLRAKGRPWGDAVLLGLFTAPFILLGPLVCAIPEDPRVHAAALRRQKAIREAWGKPDPVPDDMDSERVRQLKVLGGFLIAAGMSGQVFGLLWSQSGSPFFWGMAANALGTALYLRARSLSWEKASWRALVASPLVIIGAVLCAAPLPVPEEPGLSPAFLPAEDKWRRAAFAAAALSLALDFGATVALGRMWSAENSTAEIGYSSHGYSSLVRKSSEGASKGNLGAIRAALTIYYGDFEGKYPAALAELTTGGKYIAEVPKAKAPNYHLDSAAVRPGAEADDSGGWLYDAASGTILINCTHTDTKGSSWDSY